MSNKTVAPEITKQARSYTPAIVRGYVLGIGQETIAEALRFAGVEATASEFMDLVDEVQRLATSALIDVTV